MAEQPALFEVPETHPCLVAAGAPDHLIEAVSPLVVSVASQRRFDVYVGRNFAHMADEGWGNPLRLEVDSPAVRLELLVRFWALLRDGDGAQPAGWRARVAAGELTGAVLGCWCAPAKLCHGYVLAGYAAGLADELDAWLAPPAYRP